MMMMICPFDHGERGSRSSPPIQARAINPKTQFVVDPCPSVRHHRGGREGIQRGIQDSEADGQEDNPHTKRRHLILQHEERRVQRLAAAFPLR